jgi:N-formylglutamate deformylase
VSALPSWLELKHGDAPLIVSIPHSGTEIPAGIEKRMVSPWLARVDTDWWVNELYDFAHDLGATTLRTTISRSVVDVNRDPSGASLYPGQATTDLCPLTTFDGLPLYRADCEPKSAEITRRRAEYFQPYHDTLAHELTRLRTRFGRVVLYDAHSIRSRVPRLFDGTLPQFNIGTNNGRTCDRQLTAAIESTCHATGASMVVNGRFKGGWTTRHYGEPLQEIHAVQMELACRGYLVEPEGDLTPANWPPPTDPERARQLRSTLTDVLKTCLAFATHRRSES